MPLLGAFGPYSQVDFRSVPGPARYGIRDSQQAASENPNAPSARGREPVHGLRWGPLRCATKGPPSAVASERARLSTIA